LFFRPTLRSPAPGHLLPLPVPAGIFPFRTPLLGIFEAQKNRFKQRPSRFRMEAMNMALKEDADSHWDYGQSLWDSYEIVTLSKKLEASLCVDDPVVVWAESGRRWKRRRESSNSLRNLFQRITYSSSKRLDADFFV
ncbi:hypothetical protein IHE45_07G043800, partial [Dioscorea alata]